MTIKARWGSDELVVPTGDPFYERVEQIGLPIVLHADHAEVNERLIALVQEEGRLHNAGIRCAIRDRDDTSCSACPLSAHEDPSSALHRLCQVGREQELLSTELAIATEAKRGRS